MSIVTWLVIVEMFGDMKHDREISQVITGILEYLYVNLQAEENANL